MKLVLFYIAVGFTLLSLIVLIRWQLTENHRLEPLAQIFGTIAALALIIVSLMP